MNKCRPGVRSQESGGKAHPAGFTLLEVLLALAILAVIVTSIYGSFSTAARTIKQAEEIRDGADMARALISRMANDISNAYLGGITGTFLYGKKAETEGEEKQRIDSIDLTTLTNWRKPDSREMDLWEVGYHFKDRPDGTGRMLVRREKRELSKDIPPLEGGVEYELTDAVEALQIRYQKATSWSDTWDSRRGSGLPTAVEIVLTLADGRVYMTQADIRNQ